MISDVQEAVEALTPGVEFWTPRWWDGPVEDVIHYVFLDWEENPRWPDLGPWAICFVIDDERSIQLGGSSVQSVKDLTNKAHGICFDREEAMRIARERVWIYKNNPDLSTHLLADRRALAQGGWR